MSYARRPDPVPATAPSPLDASRFTSTNRRRLSGPAMRTFIAIADLWALSQDERLLVLGLPSRSTYYGWVRAAREGDDFDIKRFHMRALRLGGVGLDTLRMALAG